MADAAMSADDVAFPTLGDVDLATLRRFGRVESVEQGRVLQRAGDVPRDFHAVVSGSIDVVVRIDGREQVLRRHQRGGFLGELSLLTGQRTYVEARMAEAGELIVVPQVNVIPIPDSLSFEDAASVPLVFLTAWHMLTGRAALRPGLTVLVLGGNSGVGIAAIQVCKLFNATVIATAGNEKKMERSRALGADHVVHHYKQKISEEVKRITGGAGVDIVVEHVGKSTWDESVKSLKPAGTLVTCGATTGPDVGIDLRFVYSRQLSILGSYMGTMGELHQVLKHVFTGELKPVVDSVFALKDARAAHEHMEKSEMFGKIVLKP